MNSNIRDIYKTLTMLCVEDDKNVLEIYKEMFSLMFKEVYFAQNGNEGFECFEQHNIDIVLTDYKMPECDGLEMSERIRKIDATVPIIMVTALESMDMLKRVIDVHITSFLKKPFTSESMFLAFNLAVKSIIAERILLKEQTQQISYNDYQENLTYAKEKTIIKNDLGDCKRLLHYHCEVFYQPKDTLSGDSYLIKKLSNDEFFVFIVDGMGKGISASVTAMMSSAFLNYQVEKLLKKGSFSLRKMIKELFRFIHPNLLEEEVVSASFIYFNGQKESCEYALFSMPPLLYMKPKENNVHKIRSNNPPITKYSQDFTIGKMPLQEVEKLLVYSDGLNENILKNSEDIYAKYIQDDFKKAIDLKMFETLRTEKVEYQDDDITYLFLTSN